MTAKRTTAKPKPTAKKQPPAAGLQRHPLSEKFSLPFSEAERLALAEDMKANGQQYEVILHEGMVLDGWERYMGCLATGLTVKTKQYTGDSPAAVAFGANAIRRKLSSVQKALFGAKYFVHCTSEGTTISQKQVASSVCCSLQRLNEIVQLLRKVDTDKAAAKCVAKLSTDPDITTAMLQQMLGEVGIIDVNARKPKAGATGPEDDDEEEEDDDELTDNNVDDLLGGADIDDLLDDDETPTRVTPRDKSANPAGPRIGTDKRARETPASATSRDFRALTEPERLDFVKFAWPMLRPAIEKCVSEGRVEWPLLHVTADAGKAALADVAGALTRGKGKSKPAPTKPQKLAPKKTVAQKVKPPSKPAAKPGKKAAAPAPAPSPGKPAPKPAPAPFPKPAPGGVPPAPAPAPTPAPSQAPAAPVAPPVAAKAKTAPAKARKQATADV